MEKEFVPYEQALALKGLGFDKPCFAYYEVSNNLVNGYRIRYLEHEDANPAKQPSNEDCLAPLYQQAFRWFREKYKLDSYIKHLYKSTIKVGYYFNIDKENGIEYNSMEGTLDYGYFKTYEEAELECLNKLIKIVKDGK